MQLNGIDYFEVDDVVVMMFGRTFKGITYTDPDDVVNKLLDQMRDQGGPIGGRVVDGDHWPGEDNDAHGADIVVTRPRIVRNCMLVDMGFRNQELGEALVRGEYRAILRAMGGNFDPNTQSVSDPMVVTVDITESRNLSGTIATQQLGFLYYHMLVDEFGAVPNEDPDNAHYVHHLAWMAQELAQGNNGLADDAGKANRWIGFIQGCLVAIGASTVAEERERTRPYFQNNGI